MGTLPLVVMPDLKRFHDFKPKFEQRFQQELHQPAPKIATPAPSTVLAVRVQPSSLLDQINARIKASSRPATANASTQPQSKPNLPSTSTTHAGTPAPPPGQTAQPASCSTDQSHQSDCNPPTDILSAFKAANNLLDNVFRTLPQGPKETNVNRFPKAFSPAEFYVRFSAEKTKALEILKKATAHDQEAEKRVMELFESGNYLKYEEVVLKSRQREHKEKTVRHLVEKRFSLNMIEVSWLEACKNVDDVEIRFLADDDLVELELVKGFGTQWEAFYRKLKKDKALDFYKAVEYLREYRSKLMDFLASELCVSARDFHWEDRGTRLMIKTPVTNWSNLKPKVAQLMEEVKKPLLEKVLSNRKSEEACVAKAVEFACEKYKEAMWARMQESGTIEDLHRTVYAMTKKCFETVADFEYTKLWVWPWGEPPKIKQYFKEAQEEHESRRVARIKEQAASLLDQLEPDQLIEFWRGRFPQLSIGGGNEQSVEGSLNSNGSGKRLAIEQGPSKSTDDGEVEILAVKRAKGDHLIDGWRTMWEEIKPVQLAASAPPEPPTPGAGIAGTSTSGAPSAGPSTSASVAPSGSSTATTTSLPAGASSSGAHTASHVGKSPTKRYNLRTPSKLGVIALMKTGALKKAVDKGTVTILGPGMYHNRVAASTAAPTPEVAKFRQMAQRPESSASSSSSSSA